MWIPAPLTRAGSGSAPPAFRFRYQSSSREETVGISGKLNSWGGDGMAHSRVAPFHGSAGALAPDFAVLKMLTRKTRKARPRTKAPAVSS